MKNKFIINLACYFASIVILSLAAAAAADSRQSQSSGSVITKIMELGQFKITITRKGKAENTSYTLDMEYNGNKLPLDVKNNVRDNKHPAFSDVKATIYQDTPQPGLNMLALQTYSGGAHCCFEGYIMVHGPEVDVFTHVSLLHGTDSDTIFTGNRMGVVDWSFAYYKNNYVKLPFAYSPGFTRYLVFDNYSWRPDQVGEYPKLYEKFLAQETDDAEKILNSGEDKPEDYAIFTSAIAAVYYHYMIYGDAKKSEEFLTKLLSKNHASAIPSTWNDIEKAVKKFKPQTNIVLRRPSNKDN